MKIKTFISLCVILSMNSCTKESQFRLPLHENSFDWIMNGAEYFYINQLQDTLFSESQNSTSQYFTEGSTVPGNSDVNSEYQVYDHVLQIDSFITYKTRLLAQFIDGERSDAIFVQLTDSTRGSAGMIGSAEPFHSFLLINTTAFYDSLYLNSELYLDIYSSSSSSLNVTMFVNKSNVLAGFALEGDTFNLSN